MNGQVKCPDCGTTNTEDSKFCKSCASAIPTTIMQRDAIEPEASPVQPLADTSTTISQPPLPAAATPKETNSTNGAAISPKDDVALRKIRKKEFVALGCIVGSIAILIVAACLGSSRIPVFIKGGTTIVGIIALFASLIYQATLPSQKRKVRRLAAYSIDSTLPYQDIIKDIDTQFLSRGWNVKFRTQDQLVYEQKMHGRAWLAILLGLLAIVGGILYYFLSDRRESVIFQLAPLSDNQSIKVEMNLQACERKASQEFALSVLQHLQ